MYLSAWVADKPAVERDVAEQKDVQPCESGAQLQPQPVSWNQNFAVLAGGPVLADLAGSYSQMALNDSHPVGLDTVVHALHGPFAAVVWRIGWNFQAQRQLAEPIAPTSWVVHAVVVEARMVVVQRD